MGAFETGTYPNLFAWIGKGEEETEERLEQITKDFFYGEESFYHEAGDDMAYIEDTGNHDVRTEGMSYGMMICVQRNMQKEFDKLWKWACTYMWMDDGENAGYFAWSCGTDGKKNANGPAPDGEEFFAMALFFASKRWGDGDGIFEYSEHAKKILHSCIHKGEDGIPGAPMWNHENHQILFVPGIDFTDASYHLPHFYELFALWAYEEDRAFFAEAAKASRKYLQTACHPETGMNPEYGEFDGSPMSRPLPWSDEKHDKFFSDAYRTAANIGLDYVWYGDSEGQEKAPVKLLRFLDGKENPFAVYEVDGTFVAEHALHPVGMLAASVQGLLTCYEKKDDAEIFDLGCRWLTKLWETPLRSGDRRYYDNCLYFFAYLALSGQYRIWK